MKKQSEFQAELTLVENGGKLKAAGSVVFSGLIRVFGIEVHEFEDEHKIYYEVFFPEAIKENTKPEALEECRETVLAAYETICREHGI
jgi:hypothetical protein